MKRTIKPISEAYLTCSLDLVETVFTEANDEEEGKMVRLLVEEIRHKRYHIPELELIALDSKDNLIGYAMFSRFQLQGQYEQELLILAPVAVKTSFQRQHISKELIEYGFVRAKEMGFKAVIVEGNPQNYRSRGFQTAVNYGIMPGKSVHLPAIECLMVKELEEGALTTMKGLVEYDDYEALK